MAEEGKATHSPGVPDDPDEGREGGAAVCLVVEAGRTGPESEGQCKYRGRRHMKSS